MSYDESSTHEARLLELHASGLQAHLEQDVDALLATQADTFVVVNRGELSTPTKEQRRSFLGPYLASTRFDFYRDRVPPVVRVSSDGTLGWVIAQVEARGTQTTELGEERPIEFVVSWVELYERQGAEWLGVGNASSFPSGK